MKENIWKILHKPTGLFYCSRKGRFNDEKTNLSLKGNFYTSERAAKKVYKDDCMRGDINRAQVGRYKLTICSQSYWSYSKAIKCDFKIIKYNLEETKE